MIDLYSHNSGWPAPLPFRVRLENGTTRTDPETFTQQELAAWGYVGPYEIPSYKPRKEHLEWTGTEFLDRAGAEQ